MRRNVTILWKGTLCVCEYKKREERWDILYARLAFSTHSFISFFLSFLLPFSLWRTSRLDKEVSQLRRLQHPNLVCLADCHVYRGDPVILERPGTYFPGHLIATTYPSTNRQEAKEAARIWNDTFIHSCRFEVVVMELCDGGGYGNLFDMRSHRDNYKRIGDKALHFVLQLCCGVVLGVCHLCVAIDSWKCRL